MGLHLEVSRCEDLFLRAVSRSRTGGCLPMSWSAFSTAEQTGIMLLQSIGIRPLHHENVVAMLEAH
jgi:hypothetical protein